MKRIFLVFSSVLFFAPLVVINPLLFAGGRAAPVTIDQSKLKADVNFLCSIRPPRNDEHTVSLDAAAGYIINELKAAGYTPEEQKFKAGEKEYKNIICSCGPKDAERIIVGAHYDVCGNQAGADDNASGIAGLLEIARKLAKENPPLAYRVDMVFYTLEEPPNFREPTMGSAIHAKYISDNKIKVKGMVCLEMIGYYSEEKNSQHYPSGIMKLFYPSKANYIAVVGKLGQGRFMRKVKRKICSACGIDVHSISALKFIPGIDFSDHLNYWKYGYDAVMITDTSFYRNDNYHRPSDLPSTLNFDKMAEVVKGIYNAVTGL